MKPQLLGYMRLAQPICCLAVFLLAIWLWWSMFLWVPADQRKFDSGEAWFILFMVGPAACLIVAGVLQAIYRWVWPAVLALLVSAVAAYVWLVVHFLFVYFGRRSSLPVVYLYLIVLLLAFGSSLVNAIIELVLRFSNRVPNNSFDASGGGVFRKIIGPAKGE